MARSILTPLTISTSGSLISSNVATGIPITFRGATSQTANLTEWQSWNGSIATTLALVDSSGRGIFPTVLTGAFTSSVGAHIGVQPTAIGNTGILIRGANGQTADLTRWETWNGTSATTVANVTSSGVFNIGNGSYDDYNADSTIRAEFRGSAGTHRTYIELQGVSANDVSNENGGAFIRFRTSRVAGYGADIGAVRKAGGASNLIFKTGAAASITQKLLIDENGNILINGFGATIVGSTIRGATYQTSDLLQFQNDSSTVLGGITGRGLLYSGSTAAENNISYNLTVGSNPWVSSSQATFTIGTTLSYQPFAVGQEIIVASCNITQYNGNWVVTAVGGSANAWTCTITAPSTVTFTNTGSTVSAGTISLEPTAFFKALSPGTAALTIKSQGASGTATDVFRYVDGTGTLKTSISAAGDLSLPALSATWSITSSASSTTTIALRARYSVSNYLTNIQTWENTSTVIAGINAQGQFFTGGTTPIQGSTTVAIGTQTPTGTTNITITTGATHGISVGQRVTIAGVTPSGYNGTWTAQSGTTGSTLVVDIGSNPGVITVAGTVTQSAQVSVAALSANNTPIVVRAAANQVANLNEWVNSSGTVLGYMGAGGAFRSSIIQSDSANVDLRTANSGGQITMLKQSNTASSPGANYARLYLRDGTTGGTLKFVAITGASGVEETIVDNLSSTGSTAGAQFRGAGGVNTTGTVTTAGLTLSSTTSPITLNASVGTTGQVLSSAGAGATPTWRDGPVDGTTSTATTGFGFMGIPQVSKSGAYTLTAADAGKHIYYTATGQTVTIPANSSVALPIGTTFTFITPASVSLSIAITTDTMYLAGTGTTGTRTLAQYGMATAVKITSTTWIISGNGLT